jgi:hypothetical protein
MRIHHFSQIDHPLFAYFVPLVLGGQLCIIDRNPFAVNPYLPIHDQNKGHLLKKRRLFLAQKKTKASVKRNRPSNGYSFTCFCQ